jgi:mannitol-1-/sugar-/sorbitol-6-phosphatase
VRASKLRCEAILFDMDGVLVDSTPVIERVWRRWAAMKGIEIAPLLEAAHGRRTRDALEAVGVELDIASEVAWLDQAELDDLEGVRAIPGAVEFVASLPPDRWAIVTSSGRELAERRLGAAGLPVPRHLVTSEIVTRGKPAPDGYHLGASRLGRSPAVTVVFEDTNFGIAAGRAAGARVIALATTYPAPALTAADHVIPDFHAAVVTIASDGNLELQLGEAGQRSGRADS